MSEANVNIGQIDSMENVLITSSKEFSLDQSSNDVINKSIGVGIAKGNLSLEFESQADSDGKNSDPLEDEESKVLMTIDADIVTNTNGQVETKEADSGQSESTHLKSSSPDFLETVQISNADSSIEITAKDIFLDSNPSADSQDSIEEETFEVVEVIGMPCVSKKLSTSSETNPLGDVHDGNNDDLIAILEGDADSTTAKNSDGQGTETIVFEVIETEDSKDGVLDPEEEKKIALEQMRNMSSKRRARQPTSAKQDGGALISSLVSDWSDNEKDSEPATQSSPITPSTTKKPSLSPPKQTSPAPAKKHSPQSSEKKIVVIQKKVQSIKKAQPKPSPPVTSMKPARIIKKKIIWDPDAPETQFSYASLIKSSITPRKPKASPKAASPVPQAQKRKNEESTVAPPVKSKPTTPAAVSKSKAETPASEKTKTSVSAKAKPISATKSKPAAVEKPKSAPAEKSKPATAEKPKPAAAEKPKPAAAEKPKPAATEKLKSGAVTKQSPTVSVAKSKTPKLAVTSAAMQPKVRILKRSTPSPNSSVQSKRKRVSEIDRLLNDEGAANMLSTLDSEKPVQKDSRARKVPTPVSSPPGAQPKKQESTKKRTGRGSGSGAWDYVYNQRNVDSLIIRRRSNSSYSSTTSPRRLSLEAKPIRMIKGKSKSFEFTKPQVKKVGKRSVGNESETIIQDIRKSAQQESGRKAVRTPVPVEPKEVPAKGGKAAASASAREDKNTSDITVKKHGNVVQLILKPKLEKIKNCFTVELMDDIVEHLEVLQADNACKVVVLTSAGTSFCQGIDFLAMTQGNLDKRKSAVQEMAASVTSFLKTLVTFPKPLVAGVIGPCLNLGLTMLPAFDVVIASDKSSFETTYAKIGQIPEGNCLISSTNNVRHAFKIKLFWLCERLTATEATLSGLVTSLTAPSKVADDAIQYAKRLAALSQQSLVALKTQKPETKKLTLTLDVEQKILIHQWQTQECQEQFKQFIAKESW